MWCLDAQSVSLLAHFFCSQRMFHKHHCNDCKRDQLHILRQLHQDSILKNISASTSHYCHKTCPLLCALLFSPSRSRTRCQEVKVQLALGSVTRRLLLSENRNRIIHDNMLRETSMAVIKRKIIYLAFTLNMFESRWVDNRE